MLPNLYATFAHSETALASYMALQNAKSSISGKAREVVNLVVSQVNECQYCLAAHTMLGKMNGFSDVQILEIRHGHASFDTKLDALARLTKGITQSRGHVDQALVENFFAAGWTKENLAVMRARAAPFDAASHVHLRLLYWVEQGLRRCVPRNLHLQPRTLRSPAIRHGCSNFFIKLMRQPYPRVIGGLS